MESKVQTHIYSVFGLVIASTIELPELISTTGTPDVWIRVGTVPDQLAGAFTRHRDFYQIGETDIRMDFPGYGRFFVSDGKEILVEPDPLASDLSTRAFILGAGMGAIFHQRGMLPLHGSSIATGKGAIIFIGQQGAGKSTTAAAFRQRGYPLIADDVSVITLEPDGIPKVVPGFPQQKLWRDSLEKLNTDTAEFNLLFPDMDKFAVPLQGDFHNSVEPVLVTYMLVPTETDKISIEPMTGMTKFTALRMHTYRNYFLDNIEKKNRHLDAGMSFGNKTHVKKVERPNDRDCLDELVEKVEADFLNMHDS